MKKLFAVFVTIPVYLLLASPAFAACSVNGQDVPCSQFWSQFGWIFVVMTVVLIVSCVFWLWLLIDCIKRDFKNKVIWVLVLLFTNIFGAVLYFFMVKRKQSTLSNVVPEVQQASQVNQKPVEPTSVQPPQA